MNEFLKKRIDRKLEALPDERVYQILDFIEFLESKYAARTTNEPGPFQKLAETVEDTMRAGKLSASAIRGTMDAMSAASRVMGGLSAAGKAVVDQVSGSNENKRIETPPPAAQSKPPEKGDAPPPSQAGSA